MARRRGRRDPRLERRWRRLIAGYGRSGLSVRAYCRRHEVSEASFYGWRREILRRGREVPGRGPGRAGRGRPAAPVRFVPLHVVPSRGVRGPGPDVGLTVVLERGRAVRVGRDFDAATLTRLLGVLEGRPC